MQNFPNMPTEYKLQPGETYIQWYVRLQNLSQSLSDGSCVNDACTLSFNSRSYIIGTIDGMGSSYPLVPLEEGDDLNLELVNNLTFSAAHLSVAQNEVSTIANNQWNNISAEDQILLTLAVYNAGANDIVLSTITTVVNQGATPDWAVIRPVLINSGLQGTVDYAENILRHAQQGGN